MRLCALALLILLVPISGTLAADKPPLDIAIYPGGENSLELNLVQEELAPLLQAVMPMMSEKLGKYAGKIKPEDILEILSGLKRIEVVQVDVTKPNTTELDMTSFYSKKLPPGKWNKLFWQTSDKLGTVALFATDGLQGFYGFRITKEQIDGKPAYRAIVGKIEGTIDFTKVLALIGKIVVAP